MFSPKYVHIESIGGLKKVLSEIGENRIGGYRLLFSGDPADGAAEYVDVAFLVGALEEAGNEVPLLRNGLFAYRTDSFYGNFLIGMTMGAAENVADPLLVSGEERRLYLRTVGQKRGAQGADSVFSDLAAGDWGCLAGIPVPGRGKEAVGENQQQEAREYQKHDIKRCWNHICI